jgi:NDP-sugar pyrophosphorylase family protein
VLEAHASSDDAARLVVGRVNMTFPYGVVEVDEVGSVRAFREKPLISRRTSLGVFVLSEEAIKLIPKTGSYGIDSLVPALLASGATVGTHPFDGTWFDIGTPDRFEAAALAMKERPERFLPRGIRR